MILGVILGAVAVLTGALSYKAAKDAQKAAKKAAESMAGVLVNKESNIEPIPVIYGERRVGGVRVFVDTIDSGETVQFLGATFTSKKNDLLFICLALCEGEVESVTGIELDDQPITDPKYSSLVEYEVFTGTDGQSASSLLSRSPKWGADHKLSGVAYVAMILKWDQDVFSGIPDITALVKGKKVYDPRTSTTAWSDNPALCIRDYLTNSRYGKGLPSSAINDTKFSAAASDIDSFTVTPYSGGSSGHKIFRCNAVLDTGEELFRNVERLLLGCRGFLPFSNGKYGLVIDQSTTAVMTLNTSKIIGGIKIQGEEKKDKFNKVIVTFPNPNTDWQPDQAIWPDAGSIEETSFQSQDGGIELVEELDIETITDYYAARDFARISCLRSRNALRCTLTATSEAMNLVVGDVVNVTHPTPGWTAKPFQVEQVGLKYDGTVDLNLIEYDSTLYAYDPANEEATYPDTDLPDPTDLDAPTQLLVTPGAEILDDGSVNAYVDLSWTDIENAFLDYYAVTVILNETGLTSQVFYEEVQDVEIRVNGLTPGLNYTASVKAVNSLGVESGSVTANFTAVGDAIPPGIPTPFVAQGGLQKVDLLWTNPSDTDLSYIEIKRSTNSTEGNAVAIGRSAGTSYVDGRPAGIASYWYWARAVDTSGNKSSWVPASNNPATTIQLAQDDFSNGIIEVDYLSGDIIDNQYSVAMLQNTSDPNQIEAHGFALIGDYDPNNSNTWTSQFIVNANKFAIGSPQIGGTTSHIPFVVYTTTTNVTLSTGDVITLQPGVYVDFLSAREIVANQITTGYLNLANEDGMHIRQGKTSASTSGTGFWLGNVNGTAKFYLGNTSNYMYFDGSTGNLKTTGLQIEAADGTVLLSSGGRFETIRDTIGSNLVYNGDFANGDLGWVDWNPATYQSVVFDQYEGTATATSTLTQNARAVQDGYIKVTEGETLYLYSVAAGANGSMAIEWFSDNGSGTKTYEGANSFSGAGVNQNADDDQAWSSTKQLRSVSVTVPTSTTTGNVTRYARVLIETANTNGNSTIFYEIGLTRIPPAINPSYAGTYIRDLSVDTLQIQNNAVTVPETLQIGSASTYLTNNTRIVVGGTSLPVDFGTNVPDKVLITGHVIMASSGLGSDWAAANVEMRYATTSGGVGATSGVVQQVSQVNSRKGAPPTLSIAYSVDGWSGARYIYLTVKVTGETTSATGWWKVDAANITVIGARR